MGNFSKIVTELEASGNQADAVFLQGFFKTGPGQYGEGDLFLGVRNPQTRAVAKKHYKELNINDIEVLLCSKWHEVRLCALVIMMLQYKKANIQNMQALYELYIQHIGKGINNWDLVDVSCTHVVGAYLSDKNRQPLYDLAKKGLWHKRVAIISTFYFLRSGETSDTYKLAEILVYEQHDLMHKAVGWSLREMGKKDSVLLYQFLDKYASTMPRTALRYALEKMSDDDKKYYLGLK